MSYPWQIQTLIVEDEQQPTENYREIFKGLAGVAPPVFAPSFDEAAKQLASSSIFHLQSSILVCHRQRMKWHNREWNRGLNLS